jgi:hypothetical protein
MNVNAVIQIAPTNVSEKKDALAREMRRAQIRTPTASINSAVIAVGTAYGENAYSDALKSDMSPVLPAWTLARGSYCEQKGAICRVEPAPFVILSEAKDPDVCGLERPSG